MNFDAFNRSIFQHHPFHLVSPSPWPLYTCISLLTLTTSGVLTMHGFNNSNVFVLFALISVVLSMSFWWRDVISEGTQLLRSAILSSHNLTMAKAIPIKEIEEALNIYKANKAKNILITKNILGHYLAGLLEGDGLISIPALGNTALNRVLNLE